MAEKKKAKFFCENCNSEVAANARFCPKCGKFFAAVRCPECGHVGSHRDFKTGCPKCHYTFKDHKGLINADGTSRKPKLSKQSKKSLREAFAAYNSNSGASSGSHYRDGAPAWLFFGSIAVLISIFTFTFFKCQ